ncbi:hypothetical protein PMIN01_11169 [Paraphaeosphaeria minitans]|uniref:Uncharacterized protein n=1 Tax=Paraphaeosphaeria minitans TaxID=565426 RepID=A0A9P6GBB8_9PLEO|nr:hypothetical protein PMIN01_11169 [Paraphaeosphaeria minitans]
MLFDARNGLRSRSKEALVHPEAFLEPGLKHPARANGGFGRRRWTCAQTGAEGSGVCCQSFTALEEVARGRKEKSGSIRCWPSLAGVQDEAAGWWLQAIGQGWRPRWHNTRISAPMSQPIAHIHPQPTRPCSG